MKLFLRAFAMMVVVAGLTSASMSSASSLGVNTVSTAMVGPGPLSLPAPSCGPGVPTCQNPPPSGLR